VATFNGHVKIMMYIILYLVRGVEDYVGVMYRHHPRARGRNWLAGAEWARWMNLQMGIRRE
jgi:hypothetical protein